MKFPRTIELDEMDAVSKEWELSGFTVFKDTRNSVGVMTDPDGSHWDRFYIRRKEFWLDMREVELAFIAFEVRAMIESTDLVAKLVGGQMMHRWEADFGKEKDPHPYERLEKLKEDITSSPAREAIERKVSAQFKLAVNAARRKYWEHNK